MRERPIARLAIHKQAMKFSAAHFTVFCAQRRERLHGHDFFVSCVVEGPIGPDGLVEDYAGLKARLRALCQAWDEVLLLPGQSPHLSLEREGDTVFALHGGQRMAFVADDVKVLPVANISLEELARLALSLLVHGEADPLPPAFTALEVSVEAGPGQIATCRWRAPVGEARDGGV